MRRILKFVVAPYRTNEVETGPQPRWLSAGWQGDQLVVWCEVAVGSTTRTHLLPVPTGAAAPESGAFVGTAQHPTMLDGSPLVMHVYAQEVRGKP